MLETQLIVIINGEDVHVATSLLAPLTAVCTQALIQSCNTGRAPCDWELRNERGAYVDAAMTVNAAGFGNNERLFLTLPVGIGGALAA